MMKSLSSYKSDGQFKNWLLKIAVNHCRDYFRSRTYKQKENEIDQQFKDEKENVWDMLSKKIDSENVKAAVEQLPDFQKEAIILKFYQDLKIKEIAELTESKEATVKSRLKQGIGKLKILLRGGNEDEKRQQK
jgi:RNA polymerase sigma factor (sigma-70 family)